MEEKLFDVCGIFSFFFRISFANQNSKRNRVDIDSNHQPLAWEAKVFPQERALGYLFNIYLKCNLNKISQCVCWGW